MPAAVTTRPRPPVPARAAAALALLASVVPPALRRRWPTALAVGFAAVQGGVDVATAGQLLPLLPLVYVVVAVLRRPRATWPVLLLSSAGLAALQAQPAVDPLLGLTAVATAVAVAGAVDRRDGARGRRGTAVQVVGYVLFAGVAAVGLAASPDLARWVLAAGWLGHGAWDLVHLRRRAVVSRSYAEWCAVLDVLVAVSLVVAA